jgi:hypothetical protein
VALVTFAVAGVFSTAGYHFPFYYLAGLALAARAVAVAAPAPARAAAPAVALVPAGAGGAAPPGWWRR